VAVIVVDLYTHIFHGAEFFFRSLIVDPEGSSPLSQDLASGAYLEPRGTIPHIYLSIIMPPTPASPKFSLVIPLPLPIQN
jgi:hypothetical protein